MSKKMTQTERILRHLKTFGSITHAEALAEYGIYQPATRIFELKRAGYNIRSEKMEGTNRFGEKVNFVKYVLEDREGI